MTAQTRGWGPPGCTATQLVRIAMPGLIDHPPYFPVRVRREVAPLFRELIAWLVAERAERGLTTTSSGGYNKRLIAGTNQWSNHSWGLAVDLDAATNPYRSPLRTDMPPGTSAKARSLGMRWGGDYTGKPDPMHFEFMGTPADAARLVRSIDDRADRDRPTEGDDVTPQDIEAVAQRVAQLLGQQPGRMPLADRLDEIRRAVREDELRRILGLPADRPPLIDLLDEIRRNVRPETQA